jgi:hypothetical protein
VHSQLDVKPCAMELGESNNKSLSPGFPMGNDFRDKFSKGPKIIGSVSFE